MNLTSGAGLLMALDSAPLLSRCGGPYSADPTILPVESLSIALNRIAGSLLDAVPHSNWDQTLTSAYRESRKAIRQKTSLFKSLTIGGTLRARERRLRNVVEHGVGQSVLGARLTVSDKVIVASHLAEFFNVISIVLDANRERDWPIAIKAAEVALEGYLPVDLAGESVLVW